MNNRENTLKNQPNITLLNSSPHLSSLFQQLLIRSVDKPLCKLDSVAKVVAKLRGIRKQSSWWLRTVCDQTMNFPPNKY